MNGPRLYSFQNMYFAGIHAGIQTAHTIARMSQKYALTEGFCNLAEEYDLEAGELFESWAMRDGGETIIVKNGGMDGDLRKIIEQFKRDEIGLCMPWDYFNESQYAANEALTNVSIVVPEHVWRFADAVRRYGRDSFNNLQIGRKNFTLISDTYSPVEIDNTTWVQIAEGVIKNPYPPHLNEEHFGKTIWLEMNYQIEELIKLMNSRGLM